MVTVIKDGEEVQTEVVLGASDGAYIEILSGDRRRRYYFFSAPKP